MKKFLNYFLIPLLILNFISFNFLNDNLKFNVDDEININYQNQATKNNLKYSENSISSQQFIDDLESVPRSGTYQLEANVDFSDSKNDDLTGIKLEDITISGNGYTLYNRDITEIFNTYTFELSEEHNGLGYYSFFQEISGCIIYNLNFDNFMLPFGIVTDSIFRNVNFYNFYYQNLTFNIVSANISDDYEYDAFENNNINANIATIGLVFQEINYDGEPFKSEIDNCCFENINFSNNIIILFDYSISTVIAPIGGVQTLLNSVFIQINFNDIYINNIEFSNNKFISGITDDNLFFTKDSEQEKYFSIFYSPFIGSATNDFGLDSFNDYVIQFDNIIFNNINVFDNINNFANYTFYSFLTPILTGITVYGQNIYVFNLNLNIQSQLDNNENVGVGNLSNPDAKNYFPEYFYYTGIYQTDWINDVYYRYIVLDNFLDSESMTEEIYNHRAFASFSDDKWYYDKLSIDQDYSLILADKPIITYQNNDFYDNSNELLNINLFLIDGRYFGYNNIYEKYYSNYTINLINKNNNETIWNGYVKVAPDGFKILFNYDYYNLLLENNLYFEISNDYHTWDQDINLRKYLPEIYNVSNIVDNNNLMISYDYVDPYNLINSIDISLYDNSNNLLESKIIEYNDSQINYYLNSEETFFETKIDDPNNYYLKFEVNCNIHRYGNPNIMIYTLRDDLIQYNENNYIEFRTQSIEPDNDKSIAIWLIVLIVIIILISIAIVIFLIYYFKTKKKNKI